MIVTDKCSRCKQPFYYTSLGQGIKKFSCGHQFHSDGCLESSSTKCPICRAVEVSIKVAVYAGGAVVGAVLAPLVAPAALGVIGFGAAGPVAGSIAALIQSSIGNVAAGSLFAMAQSVAMGGALPAIGYAAGAAVGGAAAAVVAENTPAEVGDEATDEKFEGSRQR